MDHLGYPDAVVGKDLLAADRLDRMMTLIHAPCGHGSFVLPDLIGQEKVFASQALESIDEEAAAHSVNLRLQRSCELHIAVSVSFLCLDFKELRNHQEVPRRLSKVLLNRSLSVSGAGGIAFWSIGETDGCRPRPERIAFAPGGQESIPHMTKSSLTNPHKLAPARAKCRIKVCLTKGPVFPIP